MNKAELKMKIKDLKNKIKKWECIVNDFAESLPRYDIELKALQTQLTELNKDKTGRVKIGDDLSGFDEIFITNSCGSVVASYASLGSVFLNNYIKQGRVFYDRPSAELFALREATEYKIWCKFGDDVVIVYSQLKGFNSHHLDPFLRFCYDKEAVKYNDVCDFLDSLSPEELNSIRSE